MMKVLQKTGSFFKAIVPFLVFAAIQLVVGVLGVLLAFALEMISTSGIPQDIPDKSDLVVSLTANAICLLAAFVEMKIYRFSFKDISPVRQNGRVYLLAVIFAVGAFFGIKLLNSLVMKITGVAEKGFSYEITSETIVLIFILFLTEPFVEELVFRGLMVKTFEKSFPVGLAVTVIIAANASNQLGRFVFYSILLYGMLLFIRYTFGDLKLCIVVYTIINLLYVAVNLVNVEYMSAAGIVGIAASAAAMFFMIKLASKPEEVQEE